MSDWIDNMVTPITDKVERAKFRAAAIRSELQVMVNTRDLVLEHIQQAEHDEDHLALGYASWTAYVSAEYGDVLADLGVTERRDVVHALSKTGMSTRAIAPVVGVSQKTVVKDLQVIPEVSPGDDTQVSRPVTPEDPDADDVADRRVVGLDGKVYKPTPAPRKPARRNPLPRQFHDATYEMSKVASRLEKMHKDDRFVTHKDDLERHKPDLHRAYLILRRIIHDLGDGEVLL